MPMGSAKSGTSAASFDKVFGPWASPYGANGQMTMTLHNHRPSRPVRETLNEVNPSSYFRDICVPQSLDPICGKFDTANALAKFQDDIRFKFDPLADFLRFWGRAEQQGDQIWIGLSVCPDDVQGDCERVYQAYFVMRFLVHG